MPLGGRGRKRHLGAHAKISGVTACVATLCLARERAREERKNPAFVMADAGFLPFDADRFAYVFDRGCLHNLPRWAWGTYFEAIERVLKPGGRFQLICRDTRNFPPLFSLHGVYRRLHRRFIMEKAFISEKRLLRLCPASMEIKQVEKTIFQTKSGRSVYLLHTILEKRINAEPLA